jgi:hypothetical protein
MYQPRTPNYSKNDPIKRWNLPDRVFFACGACHILAHAFLEKHATKAMHPLWIRPLDGYTGSHIIVIWNDWAFDYHGYNKSTDLIAHYVKRARQRWPGWNAELTPLPRKVLISEQKSKEINGLWLREPDQFLHNALPRAERYLDRFGPPPGI